MKHKAEMITMGDLKRPPRGTAQTREIKEKDGTGKIDGRTLRKTGRSTQIIFRTSPAYRTKLEKLATAQGFSFAETLERALDAYERELKGF